MFWKTADMKIVDVVKNVESITSRLRKVARQIDFDTVSFKAVLDAVCDIYCISNRIDDYMFVVQRAVTANVPNLNMDAFATDVLLDIIDEDNEVDRRLAGLLRFETFMGVPLLREHRDWLISDAGGVVISAYYNDFDQNDEHVVTVTAVDKTKWFDLVDRLEKGEKVGFSMGCIAGRTRCSVCGNVAKTESEFCEHVRNKMGSYYGKAWEWCEDVVFRELSYVQNPADPNAILYMTCDLNGKCKRII